jgi:hypothetical protein
VSGECAFSSFRHSPFTTYHSPLLPWRRSSTESERLASNERVEGSNPSVSSKVCFGDECKESRNQFFKLMLAGSSPAVPTNISGSSNGRTVGSEPANGGSTPSPEASINFKFQI